MLQKRVPGGAPREEVDVFAAGAGVVGWVDVGAEDGDAPGGEVVHGGLDGGEAELGVVGEGHADDGEVFADGFDEEAEGEGVGDAGGPFGDGVAGGWGDDHGVCGWEDVGGSGFLVGGADGVAGFGGDGVGVDESLAGGAGDDAGVPAVVVGEVDEFADVARGGCSAGDEVDDRLSCVVHRVFLRVVVARSESDAEPADEVAQ